MTVRGAVCLNRARTVLMRGAPGNRRYLLKVKGSGRKRIPQKVKNNIPVRAEYRAAIARKIILTASGILIQRGTASRE